MPSPTAEQIFNAHLMAKSILDLLVYIKLAEQIRNDDKSSPTAKESASTKLSQFNVTLKDKLKAFEQLDPALILDAIEGIKTTDNPDPDPEIKAAVEQLAPMYQAARSQCIRRVVELDNQLYRAVLAGKPTDQILDNRNELLISFPESIKGDILRQAENAVLTRILAGLYDKNAKILRPEFQANMALLGQISQDKKMAGPGPSKGMDKIRGRLMERFDLIISGEKIDPSEIADFLNALELMTKNKVLSKPILGTLLTMIQIRIINSCHAQTITQTIDNYKMNNQNSLLEFSLLDAAKTNSAFNLASDNEEDVVLTAARGVAVDHKFKVTLSDLKDYMNIPPTQIAEGAGESDEENENEKVADEKISAIEKILEGSIDEFFGENNSFYQQLFNQTVLTSYNSIMMMVQALTLTSVTIGSRHNNSEVPTSLATQAEIKALHIHLKNEQTKYDWNLSELADNIAGQILKSMGVSKDNKNYDNLQDQYSRGVAPIIADKLADKNLAVLSHILNQLSTFNTKKTSPEARWKLVQDKLLAIESFEKSLIFFDCSPSGKAKIERMINELHEGLQEDIRALLTETLNKFDSFERKNEYSPDTGITISAILTELSIYERGTSSVTLTPDMVNLIIQKKSQLLETVLRLHSNLVSRINAELNEITSGKKTNLSELKNLLNEFNASHRLILSIENGLISLDPEGAVARLGNISPSKIILPSLEKLTDPGLISELTGLMQGANSLVLSEEILEFVCDPSVQNSGINLNTIKVAAQEIAKIDPRIDGLLVINYELSQIPKTNNERNIEIEKQIENNKKVIETLNKNKSELSNQKKDAEKLFYDQLVAKNASPPLTPSENRSGSTAANNSMMASLAHQGINKTINGIAALEARNFANFMNDIFEGGMFNEENINSMMGDFINKRLFDYLSVCDQGITISLNAEWMTEDRQYLATPIMQFLRGKIASSMVDALILNLKKFSPKNLDESVRYLELNNALEYMCNIIIEDKSLSLYPEEKAALHKKVSEQTRQAQLSLMSDSQNIFKPQGEFALAMTSRDTAAVLKLLDNFESIHKKAKIEIKIQKQMGLSASVLFMDILSTIVKAPPTITLADSIKWLEQMNLVEIACKRLAPTNQTSCMRLTEEDYNLLTNRIMLEREKRISTAAQQLSSLLSNNGPFYAALKSNDFKSIIENHIPVMETLIRVCATSLPEESTTLLNEAANDIIKGINIGLNQSLVSIEKMLSLIIKNAPWRDRLNLLNNQLKEISKKIRMIQEMKTPLLAKFERIDDPQIIAKLKSCSDSVTVMLKDHFGGLAVDKDLNYSEFVIELQRLHDLVEDGVISKEQQSEVLNHFCAKTLNSNNYFQILRYRDLYIDKKEVLSDELGTAMKPLDDLRQQVLGREIPVVINDEPFLAIPSTQWESRLKALFNTGENPISSRVHYYVIVDTSNTKLRGMVTKLLKEMLDSDPGLSVHLSHYKYLQSTTLLQQAFNYIHEKSYTAEEHDEFKKAQQHFSSEDFNDVENNSTINNNMLLQIYTSARSDKPPTVDVLFDMKAFESIKGGMLSGTFLEDTSTTQSRSEKKKKLTSIYIEQLFIHQKPTYSTILKFLNIKKGKEKSLYDEVKYFGSLFDSGADRVIMIIADHFIAKHFAPGDTGDTGDTIEALRYLSLIHPKSQSYSEAFGKIIQIHLNNNDLNAIVSLINSNAFPSEYNQDKKIELILSIISNAKAFTHDDSAVNNLGILLEKAIELINSGEISAELQGSFLSECQQYINSTNNNIPLRSLFDKIFSSTAPLSDRLDQNAKQKYVDMLIRSHATHQDALLMGRQMKLIFELHADPEVQYQYFCKHAALLGQGQIPGFDSADYIKLAANLAKQFQETQPTRALLIVQTVLSVIDKSIITESKDSKLNMDNYIALKPLRAVLEHIIGQKTNTTFTKSLKDECVKITENKNYHGMKSHAVQKQLALTLLKVQKVMTNVVEEATLAVDALKKGPAPKNINIEGVNVPHPYLEELVLEQQQIDRANREKADDAVHNLAVAQQKLDEATNSGSYSQQASAGLTLLSHRAKQVTGSLTSSIADAVTNAKDTLVTNLNWACDAIKAAWNGFELPLEAPDTDSMAKHYNFHFSIRLNNQFLNNPDTRLDTVYTPKSRIPRLNARKDVIEAIDWVLQQDADNYYEGVPYEDVKKKFPKLPLDKDAWEALEVPPRSFTFDTKLTTDDQGSRSDNLTHHLNQAKADLAVAQVNEMVKYLANKFNVCKKDDNQGRWDKHRNRADLLLKLLEKIPKDPNTASHTDFDEAFKAFSQASDLSEMLRSFFGCKKEGQILQEGITKDYLLLLNKHNPNALKLLTKELKAITAVQHINEESFVETVQNSITVLTGVTFHSKDKPIPDLVPDIQMNKTAQDVAKMYSPSLQEQPNMQPSPSSRV